MGSEQTDEEAIVLCGTTKGDIAMRFVRAWSPLGYDRALYLFRHRYYEQSHFFRVIEDSLVQFGIGYKNSKFMQEFADTPIPDDPVPDPKIEFREGVISFAGSGPDSRTSQLFIALQPAPLFGTESWETPIGVVIDGIEHVASFYAGYGDAGNGGKGPLQDKIREGREYIDKEFPLLDSITVCEVDIIPFQRNVPKDQVVEEENKAKTGNWVPGGADPSDVAAKAAAIDEGFLNKLKESGAGKRGMEFIQKAAEKAHWNREASALEGGNAPLTIGAACALAVVAMLIFSYCTRPKKKISAKIS